MFNSIAFPKLFILAIGIMVNSYALCAEAPIDSAKKITIKHCAQCHSFGKDEGLGYGPNLFGIVGKGAGTGQGFTYSPGFIAAMSGKSWDEKLLDKWLTDTQAVVPGTGMTYFQNDPAIRKKIIFFLKSLN